MSYEITNLQARQFLLAKHGLIDSYKYEKEAGILEFIRDAGCIQYDPVDICGRNHDLVLQSRIPHYRTEMLSDLLYKKRSLIEYWDKNLSIYSVSDWPYFERIRDRFRNDTRSKEAVSSVCEEIKGIMREKESISSKDLEFSQKVDWYWSTTALSRAALETMYYQGDIVIHHRKGNIRYFSLTERMLDPKILSATDPFPSEEEYNAWRVFRRIRGVGMLPNKSSYAFIFIQNFKAEDRNRIFRNLLDEGTITEVRIEGISYPFYISSTDCEIMNEIRKNPILKPRTELIAPLDNLLWDREVLKTLFDFEYTWEIYTPKEKMKYGHYVLPLLYGTDFIGRIEIINKKKEKALEIKNIWYEKNVKVTKKLKEDIQKCLRRFMKFNDAKSIIGNIELTGHPLS